LFGALKKLWAVPELPNRGVAEAAKDAANLASIVVVVDC
jgi:hypothetical protein